MSIISKKNSLKSYYGCTKSVQFDLPHSYSSHLLSLIWYAEKQTKLSHQELDFEEAYSNVPF